MKKIMGFLFQNKKRKIITICSLVLAVIILLSAILIPAISDMNKYYKNEDEMFARLEGEIWWAGDYNSYYVFEDGNVYSFNDNPIREYFTHYLKTSNDLNSLKGIQPSECFERVFNYIMQAGYLQKNVEIIPKRGKIIVYTSDEIYETINLKSEGIEIVSTLFSNSRTNALSAVSDDEFEELFDKTKGMWIDKSDFLPDRKTFKEAVRTNPKTASLVNDSPTLEEAINNNDLSIMLALGTSHSKVNACVMDGTENEDYIFNIGLTNDESVSLDDLLDILDVYLQDYPMYPGESAHDEIKEKISNGEINYATGGTIIHSEFKLYNINFEVNYKPYNYPKNNGIYDFYLIWVTPLNIAVSDICS